MSAALPLLRQRDLRRVLAELAFRTQVIPVVVSNKQYFCIGGFHMYGAAKRVRKNEKVRVMVYDEPTDEKVRDICLSYLASELLWLVTSAPRYIGALWENLPAEYRLGLFPGINSKRSLARAMGVSYATVFQTAQRKKSGVGIEEQGNLDFGIRNDGEQGNDHEDT